MTDDFHVLHEGADFSLEVPGLGRVCVDIAFDEWPPDGLSLRLKRDGRDDDVVDYVRVERLRLAEEWGAKMRREIIRYRDRPGCNPANRALALRRLLWAAGEE